MDDTASGAGTTLTVERVIAASPEVLFDAWTDAERLIQWWGLRDATCTEAQSDCRPGGAYRIANRLPDGRVVWITGTYLTVVRPNRLTYTWQVDGGTTETVHVRFEPAGEGTRVVIHHERVPDSATAGHRMGWQDSLDGLQLLLSRS